MFTKQNTKQKVYQTKQFFYKHVMFTKQNTKQKVYETKPKFTNTLCLQTKIQNRTFTKQMFTKQKFTTQMFIKQNKAKQKTKFTDKLYLQNKHVMFIKQMFYIQFIFTKQKQTKN